METLFAIALIFAMTEYMHPSDNDNNNRRRDDHEYEGCTAHDHTGEGERLYKTIVGISDRLFAEINGTTWEYQDAVNTYHRMIYFQARVNFPAKRVESAWVRMEGNSLILDLEDKIQRLIIRGKQQWRADYFGDINNLLHRLIVTLMKMYGLNT